MKKLHFFAALLPLLGCSHLETKVSEAPSTMVTEIDTKQMKVKNSASTLEKNLNSLPSQKPLNKIKLTNQTKNKPVEVFSQTKMLNVPLIKQNPELRYGCEVTSLTMVLNYAGVKINKMELYKGIKKDPDPLKRSQTGDILQWGNPHDGFVGDMTGKRAGYAVFDQPIAKLVNDYLPDRAVNLTNQPFENVLQHVSKGYPIVVWTTGDYRLPDRWESWRHGKQEIKTPLDLHAVVLVGYDQNYVYLNDPLSGRKNVKVNKQRFIKSWHALKSRAVSYE
jgi:uncharacterized protein YvpB